MDSRLRGKQLGGRYTLQVARASGATATVWAAHDTRLGRAVAVKVLHPHLAANAEMAGRFAEEARLLATVSHPGLVAVHDTLQGPPPAIVMEWMGGGDLRELIAGGPLDPTMVRRIGIEICSALHAVHRAGLIHRDIKPANVLLSATGRTKLADFGIATDTAGDQSPAGVVMGTAKYLSPEQVRGAPLDARTDVYALAVVLYEALSGTAPFKGDGDVATALARVESDPVPLASRAPGTPPALARAVMTGLAPDPAGRWPDAASFGAALGQCEPGGQTRPLHVSPQETQPRRPAHPLPPKRPTQPKPASGHRRSRWPRLVGLTVFTSIAWLGWQLVAAAAGS